MNGSGIEPRLNTGKEMRTKSSGGASRSRRREANLPASVLRNISAKTMTLIVDDGLSKRIVGVRGFVEGDEAIAKQPGDTFEYDDIAERRISDKDVGSPIEFIVEHVIDEDNPDEILNLYLTARKVPKAKRAMLVSKIRHMVAVVLAETTPRPQWLEERSKPGSELGMLGAVPFLRRVYADVIGSEGFVFKEHIREMDDDLMSAVDAYLSQRAGRSQGLGHAHGLTFIASRPGRSRQAKPKVLKGVAP